jgi:zinc protease
MKRRLAVQWALGAGWYGSRLPAAAANPGVELPPLPGPVLTPTLPAVHEDTLPRSGLRTFTLQRAQVPLVSISLWLDVGPEQDPADQSGLAAMAATLATRGVRLNGRLLNASQLAHYAEALGSALEVQCSAHATVFSLTVIPAMLPRAMALLAAVVAQPTLASEELERERESQLDGLQLALSRPGTVASMAARRAHERASALAATPTPRSLKQLDTAAVRAFMARHYRPSNAALVLCGDITPQAAQRLADPLFAHWKALPNQAKAEPAMAPPASPSVAVEATAATPLWINMAEAGQTAVALALSGPALPAGDGAARTIALASNAVLGLNYSSRLNQSIRIKRGLSYGVSSTLQCQPESCLLLVQAQTQHATAQEVFGLMREEIERLTAAPPSREELTARVAPVVGALGRRLESVQGLAGAVVAKLAQGRSPQELLNDIPRLVAVTPEQVQAFATAWLPVASASAVLAGQAPATAVHRLEWAKLDLDRRDLGLTPAAKTAVQTPAQ